MTNIFKTQEKRDRKKRLFHIGLETLEREGWTVTKEKLGKSSVRRITKNGESKLVSIRTSQDQWIAFPPKADGTGWITLDDVDVVLAVSLDANAPHREALVHWLPADDMRERFDQAKKARSEANRVMPDRRGIWIPLYEREDASENVSYVGGGAGLDYPPIARVRLENESESPPTSQLAPASGSSKPSVARGGHARSDNDDAGRFSIGDAKRLLAASLGVAESSIKITIEA